MRSRTLAALALALALAAPTAPPAAWAGDDEPDPRIDYLGIQAGTNPEVVRFKVTNIGKENANPFAATVETVAPAPYKKVSVQVPKLNKVSNGIGGSFEFTFQLPAACDDTRVLAQILPDKDKDRGNNTVVQQVCGPKAPPPPAGQPPAEKPPGGTLPTDVVIEGRPNFPIELIFVPEHLRPGVHTLVFDPSYTNTFLQRTWNGGCEPTPLIGGQRLVGWEQDELTFCYSVRVAQTAVNFDLGMLDEVPRKLVTKALLAFDEAPVRWTDGEGNARQVPGCVAVLGTATADVASVHNQFYPNEYFNDAPSGGAREWDVSGHVQRQVAFATDPELRYGYVLRGALEQLDGDDDTSCLSEVSNLRLSITYLVPDN